MDPYDKTPFQVGNGFFISTYSVNNYNTFQKGEKLLGNLVVNGEDSTEIVYTEKIEN